jgi:hypothetical protein
MRRSNQKNRRPRNPADEPGFWFMEYGMMKLLVGSLLFVSSLAYAGERHPGAKRPVVDIGPGAHIKGPLVVRDARTGDVLFSVRADSKLDVEAGSPGVQLFSRR